mgnify:CR=1 FL=1
MHNERIPNGDNVFDYVDECDHISRREGHLEVRIGRLEILLEAVLDAMTPQKRCDVLAKLGYRPGEQESWQSEYVAELAPDSEG